MRRLISALAVAAVAALGLPAAAEADHAWNGYHWARTSNPFTLMVGDNVSSNWDPILATTSADWTQSNVLNTTIVTGQAKGRNCRPTAGRVEVCNGRYGNNGWLGIAQIWVDSQEHIVQGSTRLNDTYLSSSPYNTTAWHNLVSCQEVGHTLGLDHQDEDFDNPNLGTCMDYTSSPGTNQHPNSHDYQQLQSIYSHLDGYSTVGGAAAVPGQSFTERASWGREISRSARHSVFERHLGHDMTLITHVTWA